MEDKASTKKRKSPGRFPENNTAILAICIVIAAVMWLLTVLARDYNDSITVSLQYVNLPENKVAVKPLPSEIEVQVESDGFSLLWANAPWNRKVFLIDYGRYPGRNFLLTSFLLNDLDRSLSSDYTVNSIFPDTLFFDFEERIARKIPVFPNLDITYSERFDRSGPVQIQPDSVLVYGAMALIDTIDFIHTSSLTLQNVRSAVSTSLALILPAGDMLTLEADSVDIRIEVAEFTEKSFEIPVDILGLPDSIEVVLYPRSIELIVGLPLDKYESVYEGQFRALADFNGINWSEGDYIDLDLQYEIDYVKNVIWSPQEVEYIIFNKEE